MGAVLRPDPVVRARADGRAQGRLRAREAADPAPAPKVVPPYDAYAAARARAEAKAAAEDAMSLDEWEADHRRKVEAGLAANEDTEPLPR